MASLCRKLDSITTSEGKHCYMSKINKIQNPINQQRPVLDTVTQKVIDAWPKP
jgi:hypothetical protein